jgi:hypothetical protein
MKAKDYYAKYGEQLMKPETAEEAACSIIYDFVLESRDIMQRRKVNNDKSALAVIDELNKKWNALCEMFPTPVLNRNGFRAYMYGQLGVTKETADSIRKG